MKINQSQRFTLTFNPDGIEYTFHVIAATQEEAVQILKKHLLSIISELDSSKKK